MSNPSKYADRAIEFISSGAEILGVESGEQTAVPSARFEIDGMTVEVEPCVGTLGMWRARVLHPPECRGGWSRGNHAWQAMDAAVRGRDVYDDR